MPVTKVLTLSDGTATQTRLTLTTDNGETTFKYETIAGNITYLVAAGSCGETKASGIIPCVVGEVGTVLSIPVGAHIDFRPVPGLGVGIAARMPDSPAPGADVLTGGTNGSVLYYFEASGSCDAAEIEGTFASLNTVGSSANNNVNYGLFRPNYPAQIVRSAEFGSTVNDPLNQFFSVYRTALANGIEQIKGFTCLNGVRQMSRVGATAQIVAVGLESGMAFHDTRLLFPVERAVGADELVGKRFQGLLRSSAFASVIEPVRVVFGARDSSGGISVASFSSNGTSTLLQGRTAFPLAAAGVGTKFTRAKIPAQNLLSEGFPDGGSVPGMLYVSTDIPFGENGVFLEAFRMPNGKIAIVGKTATKDTTYFNDGLIVLTEE